MPPALTLSPATTLCGSTHGEALDPITVEVIRNKLDGIANEMQTTLVRSSFSPFVKEGLDASASLFTVSGQTLAQATAIPLHLATMIPMVERFIATFPPAEMAEGDIYAMNDPYLGGTHLPDIYLVAPVFYDGTLVALATAITHHQDVGGMSAGSLPTHATEIFQEGLRLPPLKLRDRGRMNETLLAILKLNVRTPDLLMGDLNAQIAACTIGARRLCALAETYGAHDLAAVFDTLLDRSELLTRQSLAALPRGTFPYVDYLDNDGVDLERRVKIAVAVTIDDAGLTCDFSASDPQVRGPFNSVPSGALAAGCFAIRALADPTIPTNGGCFRPLKVIVKRGTLFDPVPPAPVNARTATIKRATGCILGALREAAPGAFPADGSHSTITLAMGGRRSDGTRYVTGQALVGGTGAHSAGDGIDALETDVGNVMNQPVEALEADAPIHVVERRLRIDSGGPGKFRGGLGISTAYTLLDGELTLTHRGERHNSQARGYAGGGAGAPTNSLIVRADGTREVIPSKIVTTMHAGDTLLIETPGGAGYGDPHERDRDRLREDIENGRVSEGAATAAYGPIET
ncbi:hydantoinase B/oxoprolinase family protein [Acuticoccus mangrovi]|uniref:Hydantoinase B/oxoprolinase family protein n=1 Tax=Acuticoccus mangrovi TaxID=2796142 RepID=A0A934IIK3_9HYPH|nr:hydantoinase B/oxoprolinase family protein [Acuticoccus mangrovi]MBJ3777138.1 hydantoinase B/oxoprolinase family protein [Acuticoccus mangrovi]